jgi:hypothetical protein
LGVTVKNELVTKTSKEPWTWRDFFFNKRPKQQNMDMRFGTWNVRSLILERWGGVMWTGLVWLRIGTGGELL